MKILEKSLNIILEAMRKIVVDAYRSLFREYDRVNIQRRFLRSKCMFYCTDFEYLFPNVKTARIVLNNQLSLRSGNNKTKRNCRVRNPL